MLAVDSPTLVEFTLSGLDSLFPPMIVKINPKQKLGQEATRLEKQLFQFLPKTPGRLFALPTPQHPSPLKLLDSQRSLQDQNIMNGSNLYFLATIRPMKISINDVTVVLRFDCSVPVSQLCTEIGVRSEYLHPCFGLRDKNHPSGWLNSRLSLFEQGYKGLENLVYERQWHLAFETDSFFNSFPAQIERNQINLSISATLSPTISWQIRGHPVTSFDLRQLKNYDLLDQEKLDITDIHTLERTKYFLAMDWLYLEVKKYICELLCMLSKQEKSLFHLDFGGSHYYSFIMEPKDRRFLMFYIDDYLRALKTDEKTKGQRNRSRSQ